MDSVTLRGPDIASYEKGLNLKALPDADFYILKVTEGAGYVNPFYAPWLIQAKATGKPTIWYHFATVADSAAAQAVNMSAHADPALAGMLDVEREYGKTPSLKLVCDIIDAATAKGLRIKLVYVPQWMWHEVWGSPGLKPLIDRGTHLISSDYPGAKGTGVAQYLADGGDGGAGWASYGGMTPVMWQYTDAALEQGRLIDYNAYRGTHAQFAALLGEPVTAQSAATTGVHRTLKPGSGGDDVRALQTLLTAVRFSTQGTDGQFGQHTEAAVQHAQAAWKIAKDGVAGPDTFAHLHQALRALHYPGHPLTTGATGWNVQVVQSLLWLLGFDPAGIDANFGQHTRAAAEAFQRAVAIAVDGVVGTDTWAHLTA